MVDINLSPEKGILYVFKNIYLHIAKTAEMENSDAHKER